MKRFRFRLDVLSQILNQATRERRTALVRAVDKEDVARGKVLDIETARVKAIEVGHTPPGPLAVEERSALSDYLVDSAEALAQAEASLSGCSQAVAAARNALRNARVEARRLETLREIERERHRQASLKEEVARIDELAARRKGE
ncbi:MAG: hypothetical protein CME06_03590 [Gemmatimonadetes bacterium]|nr:hypothetical protein [Gemmatimonadota bacterium]